jgi:hypothetical protein
MKRLRRFNESKEEIDYEYIYDVDMNNYHDVITDCRITIQMYQKIVDFLKHHQNVDIMKYQSERIKFIKSSK